MQAMGPPDDLQGHPQGAGGAGDEFAGVAAIGPGELHAEKRMPEIPQQGLRAVAVLGTGGGDHDRQQPGRVDGDVTPAAGHLLSVIPAPAGFWHGGLAARSPILGKVR